MVFSKANFSFLQALESKIFDMMCLSLNSPGDSYCRLSSRWSENTTALFWGSASEISALCVKGHLLPFSRCFLLTKVLLALWSSIGATWQLLAPALDS